MYKLIASRFFSHFIFISCQRKSYEEKNDCLVLRILRKERVTNLINFGSLLRSRLGLPIVFCYNILSQLDREGSSKI